VSLFEVIDAGIGATYKNPSLKVIYQHKSVGKKGEIFLFMDSDCDIEPDALAK
jgi:hypothetical protein